MYIFRLTQYTNVSFLRKLTYHFLKGFLFGKIIAVFITCITRKLFFLNVRFEIKCNSTV